MHMHVPHIKVGALVFETCQFDRKIAFTKTRQAQSEFQTKEYKFLVQLNSNLKS